MASAKPVADADSEGPPSAPPCCTCTAAATLALGALRSCPPDAGPARQLVLERVALSRQLCRRLSQLVLDIGGAGGRCDRCVPGGHGCLRALAAVGGPAVDVPAQAARCALLRCAPPRVLGLRGKQCRYGRPARTKQLIGRGWPRLAEAGRGWPRLAEAGRGWPRLAEAGVRPELLWRWWGGLKGEFADGRLFSDIGARQRRPPLASSDTLPGCSRRPRSCRHGRRWGRCRTRGTCGARPRL
eukprot:scaffold80017_cov71-Phaeocystis_antarctica.AAC.4